jgi:nucleotide-binding universal stress UspA family protein
VYALHLIQPSDRGSFLIDPDRHAGEAVLAPLLQRARELALPIRPLAFVSTEPAHDICDLAAAQDADLVLLGLHKPLLGAARLGGMVHSVMRQAHSDVAVFLDRGLVEPRRVLIPFLGGSHDRAAMRLAQRLLRQPRVQLTVLHIVKPGSDRPGEREAVAEVMREHSGKIKLNMIEHASALDAALEEARAGYDLIVIGLGSPWGLEERAFSIQPERLVLETETSLLIVRGTNAG